MMKKFVLGFAVCCGISGMEYEYAERMKSDMSEVAAIPRRYEKGHSGSDIYVVAKKKFGWALAKMKTMDDIDDAIRSVGLAFSQENLHNLFVKVTEHPACANYVHLMFDECYANVDWRFAYISSVLSHAATCYGLQRDFSADYLSKIFYDSIESDDWGLK